MAHLPERLTDTMLEAMGIAGAFPCLHKEETGGDCHLSPCLCLYSHQRITPDERKVGGPPAPLSQRGFQQKQIVNQDLNMQHMYYMVELQALWEP